MIMGNFKIRHLLHSNSSNNEFLCSGSSQSHHFNFKFFFPYFSYFIHGINYVLPHIYNFHYTVSCDDITEKKKLLSNDSSFIVNWKIKKKKLYDAQLHYNSSIPCADIYTCLCNTLTIYINAIMMVYLLQITIGQYLLIFINKNGASIQFPEFLIQCLIRHIISTDVTINSSD